MYSISQAKYSRRKSIKVNHSLLISFLPHFSSSSSSSTTSFTMVSADITRRWLRPEVYPLFATLGLAVGICGYSLFRHITGNPEVRVNKENRAAGILENFKEGEKYAQHSLRKFVNGRSPEIMPGVNSFFTDPK